jgi:hypothetical protein
MRHHAASCAWNNPARLCRDQELARIAFAITLDYLNIDSERAQNIWSRSPTLKNSFIASVPLRYGFLTNKRKTIAHPFNGILARA